MLSTREPSRTLRRSRLRRLRVPLAAVCLSLVAAFAAPGQASAAARPSAAATAHRAVADAPGTRTGSPAERRRALVAYWTKGRIAEALANEAAAEHGSTGGAAAAGPADTTPVSSAVGKIFFDTAGGTPAACTGTVVNSPSGILILTAAHCLNNAPDNSWSKNIVFSPGYHDGEAPFGTFTAWKTDVSSLWNSSTQGDTEHDYGMIIAYDDADGETPFGAAGGYPMTDDMQTGEEPSLFGYSGTPYDGEHQEYCQELVEPTVPPLNMWQVECPNIVQGSSGGPWLVNYDYETGDGFIGGVNSIIDGNGFVASPRFDSFTQDFYSLSEELAEARP